MRLVVALCMSALVLTGCTEAVGGDTRPGAAERVDRPSPPAGGPAGGDRERGREREGDRQRDEADPPETQDEPAPSILPEPPPGAGSTHRGGRGGRLPAGVPAGAQAAVVDRIIDGDTLELHARRPGRVLGSTALTGVRLLVIDTPETVHPSEPVQCYGPAASDALARAGAGRFDGVGAGGPGADRLLRPDAAVPVVAELRADPVRQRAARRRGVREGGAVRAERPLHRRRGRGRVDGSGQRPAAPGPR